MIAILGCYVIVFRYWLQGELVYTGVIWMLEIDVLYLECEVEVKVHLVFEISEVILILKLTIKVFGGDVHLSYCWASLTHESLMLLIGCSSKYIFIALENL